MVRRTIKQQCSQTVAGSQKADCQRCSCRFEQRGGCNNSIWNELNPSADRRKAE
jgi:hypothetical protein